MASITEPFNVTRQNVVTLIMNRALDSCKAMGYFGPNVMISNSDKYNCAKNILAKHFRHGQALRATRFAPKQSLGFSAFSATKTEVNALLCSGKVHKVLRMGPNVERTIFQARCLSNKQHPI